MESDPTSSEKFTEPTQPQEEKKVDKTTAQKRIDAISGSIGNFVQKYIVEKTRHIPNGFKVKLGKLAPDKDQNGLSIALLVGFCVIVTGVSLSSMVVPITNGVFAEGKDYDLTSDNTKVIPESSRRYKKISVNEVQFDRNAWRRVEVDDDPPNFYENKTTLFQSLEKSHWSDTFRTLYAFTDSNPILFIPPEKITDKDFHDLTFNVYVNFFDDKGDLFKRYIPHIPNLITDPEIIKYVKKYKDEEEVEIDVKDFKRKGMDPDIPPNGLIIWDDDDGLCIFQSVSDRSEENTGMHVVAAICVIATLLFFYWSCLIAENTAGNPENERPLFGVWTLITLAISLLSVNALSTLKIRDPNHQLMNFQITALKNKMRLNWAGMLLTLGAGAILFGFLDNYGLKLGTEALEDGLFWNFGKFLMLSNNTNYGYRNDSKRNKKLENLKLWIETKKKLLKYEYLEQGEDKTNKYDEETWDMYEKIEGAKSLLGNASSDVLGAALGAGIGKIFEIFTGYAGDIESDHPFILAIQNPMAKILLEGIFIGLGCLIPVFIHFLDPKAGRTPVYALCFVYLLLLAIIIATATVPSFLPSEMKSSGKDTSMIDSIVTAVCFIIVFIIAGVFAWRVKRNTRKANDAQETAKDSGEDGISDLLDELKAKEAESAKRVSDNPSTNDVQRKSRWKLIQPITKMLSKGKKTDGENAGESVVDGGNGTPVVDGEDGIPVVDGVIVNEASSTDVFKKEARISTTLENPPDFGTQRLPEPYQSSSVLQSSQSSRDLRPEKRLESLRKASSSANLTTSQRV